MKQTLELQDLRDLLDRYSSLLPEEALRRVVVDEAGGLAYPLFGSRFSNPWSPRRDLVIPCDAGRGRIDLMVLYLTKIQDYVDDAEQHARVCGGFNLVYISEEGVVHYDDKINPMMKLGVGKIPISSPRKVAKFCQMINLGHDRFKDRYKNICDLKDILNL